MAERINRLSHYSRRDQIWEKCEMVNGFDAVAFSKCSQAALEGLSESR